MKKDISKNIGILGGTFDPPHKGHVKISLEAKKKFNLSKIFWAVTKKNPFKKKTVLTLRQRINYSKKINAKNQFIKVNCYENRINSSKTIDLIKYFKRKYKTSKIYFLMGADNLITFHKWKGWKKIAYISEILVFDRNGYKKKSLKSISYKKFNKKGLKFINFKKINISSSQLRKI